MSDEHPPRAFPYCYLSQKKSKKKSTPGQNLRVEEPHLQGQVTESHTCANACSRPYISVNLPFYGRYIFDKYYCTSGKTLILRETMCYCSSIATIIDK